MTDTEFPLIAKTMTGLEAILANELVALGANNVEIGNRMVSFTGDNRLLYKANLHCRTAMRILKPLHTFTALNPDEIYSEMCHFDWDRYLSLSQTFAIDSVVFSSIFTHSKYVAYRVKDAISDFFTQKYGKRPSVSVSNPDLLINMHVAHNRCTLSLDSSGDSLHKRGYRTVQTEAPINEVLAAGIILKSGWHGECDFFDPMCGSGTFLIEAALIARNIPPGVFRSSFAFEKWNDFDEQLFNDIYNDDSAERPFNHKILGSDISPRAIAIATENVKQAGLQKDIALQVKSFESYDIPPVEKGIIVTNPPYGERMNPNDLDALYAMIGERLKHVYPGFKAWIISYHTQCFHRIALKHTQKYNLKNGALDCELRAYDLFEGKKYNKNRSNENSH